MYERNTGDKKKDEFMKSNAHSLNSGFCPLFYISDNHKSAY